MTYRAKLDSRPDVPLHERLNAIAESLAFADDTPILVRDTRLADLLADLAREVEDNYIRVDKEGDVPTVAQGVELARFLQPFFRGTHPSEYYATVSKGGNSLPDGYIHVRMGSGYEGGISREGQTST